MDDAIPHLPKLEYGSSFNRALCDRLERHFNGTPDAEGRGGRALVVGLFGEWGSGKTLHLQHILQSFSARLDSPRKESDGLENGTATRTPSLIFPIFFNAWRYEAEPHLIIPLLKTTQHQLRQWSESKQTVTEKGWKWVCERAARLGNIAVALSYGFKGELEIPLFGKMEFNPSAIVEEDKKRLRQQEENAKSAIDRLGSLYYDFETEIRALIGGDGSEPRLNLLFLIDDLDRCLPEKAVQMLESIKLFLDVEGCAFVLALDDEVVERGIAHRYRDYGPHNDDRALESIAHSLHPDRFRAFRGEQDHGGGNPITGHEYLEKIVQLPVRIPTASAQQVERYLAHHFSPLFSDADNIHTGETAGLSNEPGRAEADQTKERETRRALRALIQKAVPPVPRKLNRVGELYGLYLDIAARNGWQMQERSERLTLLRLVILQLLAPDLHRFGRHERAFLKKLEDWQEKYGNPVHLDTVEEEIRKKIKTNEATLKEKPGDPQTNGNLYPLRRIDQPLLKLVRTAQQHRSRFDPLKLIDLDHRSDDRIHRYFNLEIAVEPSFIGEPPSAAPSNPQGFFNQLFSTDKTAWRNALEQEADQLAGHILDTPSFRSAGTSGMIYRWRLDQEVPLGTLHGHLGEASSLMVRDGHELISAGADGLRFWSLDEGRCYRWRIILDGGVVMAADDEGLHFTRCDQQPWHTVRSPRGPRPLPSDPLLHRYARFNADHRWLLPVYKYPDRYRWDDDNTPRRLTLPWPEDYDYQSVLGRAEDAP